MSTTPISISQLLDAATDANTLNAVVNGPASGTGSLVTTRLGVTIPTLANAIANITGGGGSGTGIVLPFAGKTLGMLTDSYGAAFGSKWFPPLFALTGFSAGHQDMQSGRQTSNIFGFFTGATEADLISAIGAAFGNDDCIMIQMGTNDGPLVGTIGTMADGAYSSSYYSVWIKAITFLQRACPGIPIVVVGPLHYDATGATVNFPGYNPITDATSLPQRTVIKTVCEYYAAIFIDMYTLSGVGPLNWDLSTRDRLHLTDTWYQNHFGPVIAREMNLLVTVSTSGTFSSGSGLTTPTLAFVSVGSKLQSDAPFTISATSSSPGAITFAVVSGPASISGNTVTLDGGLGSVVLSATVAASGSFTSATAQQTVIITTSGGAVAPTMSFSLGAKYTSDAPFAVNASSNSTGAITYSITSGPATVSGNTVTLTGSAGTVVVLASQATATGFTTGTISASFGVTVLVAANPNLQLVAASHLATAAFTVLAISDSPGAITYSVVSGPATNSGLNITFTGAGVVILQVDQVAATGYASASAQCTLLSGPAPSGTNLFVAGTITVNTLLENDGTTFALAGYYTTDYIPVIAGKSYEIGNGLSVGNPLFGANFYDASHTLLSHVRQCGVSSTGGVIDTRQCFTATANGYIRFSGDNTGLSGQYFIQIN
jgi:hypothetical protein